MSTTGLVTAVALGSANLTASQGGITGNNVAVTVSAAVVDRIVLSPELGSRPAGTGVQLTAESIYSDSRTVDITNSATWSTVDTAIATVGAQGFLEMVATGSTSVTASQGGIEGTLSVTVDSTTLNSIAATPTSLSVTVGDRRTLRAEGTYSDGDVYEITTAVTWTSNNTAIVTMTNQRLTAVAVGSANVTATQGGITSNSVAVTVSP